MLDCRQDILIFVLLTWLPPHTWHYLNQISLSWSHQTTWHSSSNPCPLLVFSKTVCGLSCLSSLEEASFWYDCHADQFDAVCDVWSEHWQADLFNLRSNACSTHTSISQTQPLDMTLSMCTQLLWSTMARPVLSVTCPVKPLYGLGHHAAA